jgi:hypothetical protein
MGPDFFALKGYRLMAAEVLSTAIKDLHSSHAINSAWAAEWFSRANGKLPNAGPGLGFQDCLDALGYSSKTDEIRRVVREDHKKLISLLDVMCKALRETRGDVLDAVDFEPIAHRASGSLFQVFPAASMNTDRPIASEHDRSAA